MARQILGHTTASYSLGIVAPSGRLVFISGQVAQDENGQLIGKGDLAAQTRAVFENIKRLVQEAGGSLDDVVKIATFLTSMEEYATFARIRADYFPGQKPASSTVKVSGLVSDDFLIEVEAIAVIP